MGIFYFLSVVNFFALNYSGNRLYSVPIAPETSVEFTLFFFTLLFSGTSFFFIIKGFLRFRSYSYSHNGDEPVLRHPQDIR